MSTGTEFDLPCSDNVTFIVAHNTLGISYEEYLEEFLEGGQPPINQMIDFSYAIALHNPIFPGLLPGETPGTFSSDEITFSLENTDEVESANLYIRLLQTSC